MKKGSLTYAIITKHLCLSCQHLLTSSIKTKAPYESQGQDIHMQAKICTLATDLTNLIVSLKGVYNTGEIYFAVDVLRQRCIVQEIVATILLCCDDEVLTTVRHLSASGGEQGEK